MAMSYDNQRVPSQSRRLSLPDRSGSLFTIVRLSYS